jgi:hypothetical protein
MTQPQLSAEALFDDDLFDAEVIVSRWGCDTFTARELGMMLGSATPAGGRQRVIRGRQSGEFPPPAVLGRRGASVGSNRGSTDQEPDRWTKRQVVGIVAERLRNGGRVVVLER